MKLIFIKLFALGAKIRREKREFFPKKETTEKNRILRLFLSANSMGNKNIQLGNCGCMENLTNIPFDFRCAHLKLKNCLPTDIALYLE